MLGLLSGSCDVLVYRGLLFSALFVADFFPFDVLRAATFLTCFAIVAVFVAFLVAAAAGALRRLGVCLA